MKKRDLIIMVCFFSIQGIANQTFLSLSEQIGINLTPDKTLQPFLNNNKSSIDKYDNQNEPLPLQLFIHECYKNNIAVYREINTKEYSHITLLGTGVNINSTYKFSGTKIGNPLSYNYLKEHFNHISNLSYNERIVNLDMNPDRADVIIPALKIYLSAMKWSGAESVYVPKIGLSDGIIRSLYNESTTK